MIIRLRSLAYWFENDARLNIELLEQLRQQRAAWKRVYLPSNREHVRASDLIEQLSLGRHLLFGGVGLLQARFLKAAALS
jgi:hypothetical protein